VEEEDHGEAQKTKWTYRRFLNPVHKQETVFVGGGNYFIYEYMITILPSVRSRWSVMGTTEYISVSYKGPSKCLLNSEGMKENSATVPKHHTQSVCRSGDKTQPTVPAARAQDAPSTHFLEICHV
jgi:hypothetical protein